MIHWPYANVRTKSYKCAADSYNAYPGSMSENPIRILHPLIISRSYRSNVRNPHHTFVALIFAEASPSSHPATEQFYMRLNNALDLDT